MLCHPELHPGLTYALRNAKSRFPTPRRKCRIAGKEGVDWRPALNRMIEVEPLTHLTHP